MIKSLSLDDIMTNLKRFLGARGAADVATYLTPDTDVVLATGLDSQATLVYLLFVEDMIGEELPLAGFHLDRVCSASAIYGNFGVGIALTEPTVLCSMSPQ
jgi:hypothetical protein